MAVEHAAIRASTESSKAENPGLERSAAQPQMPVWISPRRMGETTCGCLWASSIWGKSPGSSRKRWERSRKRPPRTGNERWENRPKGRMGWPAGRGRLLSRCRRRRGVRFGYGRLQQRRGIRLGVGRRHGTIRRRRYWWNRIGAATSSYLGKHWRSPQGTRWRRDTGASSQTTVSGIGNRSNGTCARCQWYLSIGCPLCGSRGKGTRGCRECPVQGHAPDTRRWCLPQEAKAQSIRRRRRRRAGKELQILGTVFT
mmetsp:Transcript_8703/g.18081  ORF Transcript_8703/g.18081 Transcript_8703/m.18081 type:complete len:255 (+) Transcript_8703:957-1721(+)